MTDGFLRRSETDRATWRRLCWYTTPRRALDGEEVLALAELVALMENPPEAGRGEDTQTDDPGRGDRRGHHSS